MSPAVQVIQGEAHRTLCSLPSESVHCIVTSPPYWQLRDYGHEDQIGLEPTPSAFIAQLVAVFDEARRVLRSDGTLWLNLGDTYVSNRNGGIGATTLVNSARNHHASRAARTRTPASRRVDGLKTKDLVGIPWRVALALQQDGWYLRADIIWHKPTAMPNSVRDRPTTAHEYVFLLSKHKRYYYDEDSLRTPLRPSTLRTHGGPGRGAGRVDGDADERVASHGWAQRAGTRAAKIDATGRVVGASARSVWSIKSEAYRGEHTSTFPRELARRCIVAGCPPGGTVLDPFCGTGTVLEVALRTGRSAIGIDLSPMCDERLANLQLPLMPRADSEAAE